MADGGAGGGGNGALALASHRHQTRDSQQVLALSDESYRRRQEAINQRHSVAIKMNSAAAYVLALRFRQVDNKFQDIAGEMGELREGIQGQHLQVGALVETVDGIQAHLQQQNGKIAELEQEVHSHMDEADARLRHYEELYDRQTRELRCATTTKHTRTHTHTHAQHAYTHAHTHTHTQGEERVMARYFGGVVGQEVVE
jgi:hypothetical protein